MFLLLFGSHDPSKVQFVCCTEKRASMVCAQVDTEKHLRTIRDYGLFRFVSVNLILKWCFFDLLFVDRKDKPSKRELHIVIAWCDNTMAGREQVNAIRLHLTWIRVHWDCARKGVRRQIHHTHSVFGMFLLVGARRQTPANRLWWWVFESDILLDEAELLNHFPAR